MKIPFNFIVTGYICLLGRTKIYIFDWSVALLLVDLCMFVPKGMIEIS